MVKELRLVNMNTREELFLEEDTGTLILNAVDWGTPQVTFNSYRVPLQIGETKAGIMVGTREILITGYVLADMSKVYDTGLEWQEYLSVQEKLIEQEKARLNTVITPYEDVKVHIGEYSIVGTPESPVRYGTVYKENNEVLCLFELNLLCHNPMFEKDTTKVELSNMINMFHFPLVLPVDTGGTVFGEVFPRTVALVENFGSVPVGCRIVMQAHGGSVRNPKILNVNTGEFIGFDGVTLENNESVIINTKIGEESAVKRTSSSERQLIGNIMEGSTFLQIKTGQEFYYYDMDGSEQNLYTYIEFSENYFNLAVM